MGIIKGKPPCCTNRPQCVEQEEYLYLIVSALDAGPGFPRQQGKERVVGILVAQGVHFNKASLQQRAGICRELCAIRIGVVPAGKKV